MHLLRLLILSLLLEHHYKVVHAGHRALRKLASMLLDSVAASHRQLDNQEGHAGPYTGNCAREKVADWTAVL